MKADTPTILKEILKELKKLNSILDKRLPVPSKAPRQDEIWEDIQNGKRK